jgi:RNA-directed DNA polymerase
LLNIHTPRELASLIQTSLPELHAILRRADDFCEELVLLDSNREVINPCGMLRRFQDRFHCRVLLPRLGRSPNSHGGVAGRSILTNALPHVNNCFVFTTDIADFYPRIHQQRVFRLFCALGCSDEVARLCTRLCTYRHRLEQGLITSPIIADQLMRPVDRRIAGVCRKHGLVYSRFVDDLAISGPFDFRSSSFPKLIKGILAQHGFETNPAKDRVGSFSKGAMITNLRVSRGHLDVRKDYGREVERQLLDAASLCQGGPFVGPYYTKAQMYGRVCFICWVNARRRRTLHSLLNRIDWIQLRTEGQRRGYEAVKKEARRADL